MTEQEITKIKRVLDNIYFYLTKDEYPFSLNDLEYKNLIEAKCLLNKAPQEKLPSGSYPMMMEKWMVTKNMVSACRGGLKKIQEEQFVCQMKIIEGVYAGISFPITYRIFCKDKEISEIAKSQWEEYYNVVKKQDENIHYIFNFKKNTIYLHDLFFKIKINLEIKSGFLWGENPLVTWSRSQKELLNICKNKNSTFNFSNTEVLNDA